MNNSTSFCIAGMHRSGTSLVAGWLYNSGIFLGDSLLKSASSNPKGHFEDEEVLEFHSKIIEREGFHRSGLTITKNDFQFDKNDEQWIDDFLNRRINHSLWAWKEPRSTLFLEQWKKIIPNLKVIGIYRRPEFVVDSLYKRLKKNKWYFTRNPIKKIKWFIDINLSKSKWYKRFSRTYSLYNQELISFQKKYPEDIILFEINDIISDPSLFQKKVNALLNSKIELIQFEKFYSENLLNNTEKIKIDGIDNSVFEIYNSLKNNSTLNG